MNKCIFLILFLIFSSSIFATDRKYIFNIQKLTQIAQETGRTFEYKQNPKEFLETVNRKIYESYPELVVPPEDGLWTFNSVGGSLAEIKILYCSPTEYLALWGSPLTTEGFSGRYPDLDVWDIMLSGLMKSYAPGQHQYNTYQNNPEQDFHQTSFLPKGVGKHFSMTEGSYMIDYGRGSLITALGAGAMLGHKYVTGDKKSKKEILAECTRLTFMNANPKRRAAIKKYKEENPE